MAVQDVTKLAERMKKLQGSLQGSGGSGGFGRDSSVVGIATKMMGDDSRLMRQAATEGRQFANKRGLLNSSIAAGASKDAALKYVTPFAQQDSAQIHQSDMSRQEYAQQGALAYQGFEHQGALSKQGFEQQGKLAEQAFGHQGKLSKQGFEQQGKLSAQEAKQMGVLAEQAFGHRGALSAQEAAQLGVLAEQEFGYRGKLSAQEFAQQSRMSAQEFGQQGKLSAQESRQQMGLQEQRAGFEMDLAKLDANTRKDLLDREAAMRAALQDNELSASAREQMSGMFTNMNDQYQKSVNSILANPDLPAAERKALLRTAGELLQSQVDTTKSIFKMDFNWLDAAFNPNTGTPKPKAKPKSDAGSTTKPATTTKPKTTGALNEHPGGR